jgi:hypothetical protein
MLLDGVCGRVIKRTRVRFPSTGFSGICSCPMFCSFCLRPRPSTANNTETHDHTGMVRSQPSSEQKACLAPVEGSPRHPGKIRKRPARIHFDGSALVRNFPHSRLPETQVCFWKSLADERSEPKPAEKKPAGSVRDLKPNRPQRRHDERRQEGQDGCLSTARGVERVPDCIG